jgi:hypothetical protein
MGDLAAQDRVLVAEHRVLGPITTAEQRQHTQQPTRQVVQQRQQYPKMISTRRSTPVKALAKHTKSYFRATHREMRKLRAEMHRRMLGNGYCARPVELDCHFESICESCTFFVTTIEFRPTLEKQRDDVAAMS